MSGSVHNHTPVVDVAVVIVTHNRHSYLEGLLRSLLNMTRLPRYVVVVDNASGDRTQDLISEQTTCWPPSSFINLCQPKNLGGSGGFAAGVARAMETGTQWLWIMDDDVEALPDGLERLMQWTDKFKCIHGQRLNSDGSHFFFQPHFYEWLGVPLIWLKGLREGSHRQINVGCFEGMFVHRTVVAAVGVPDARYFQTWDDAIYGWQISLITPVALVSDYTLRRMREQRQINLGVRHLNDASDQFRFYVMRNRGYVAQALIREKRYSPLGFAVGTMLVFAKELTRLLLVERRVHGMTHLYHGWRAAKALLRDRSDLRDKGGK